MTLSVQTPSGENEGTAPKQRSTAVDANHSALTEETDHNQNNPVTESINNESDVPAFYTDHLLNDSLW